MSNFAYRLIIRSRRYCAWPSNAADNKAAMFWIAAGLISGNYPVVQSVE